MMELRGGRSPVLAACVALAVLSLSPGVLGAQQLPAGQAGGGGDGGFSELTYLTLGYTVNAPDQMLGAAATTVGAAWGGWGLYADAKLSRETPEDDDRFDPTRTATDVQRQTPSDELFLEESGWRSLNGALVRKLGDDFAVYAGGGVTRETAYDQYRSEELRGTAEAYYWVEDEVESETALNLLGGGLFRATRNLVFQFGAESNPSGVTVGAALALPLGG